MDLGRERRGQLLMSTVFFARETLPRRKKNSRRRFITITSAAVKQPVDGLLLSNSVRASERSAVTRLARTARLDNLAKSISTRTNVKPQEVFAGWAREIPVGRIGTPEEFAAVVAFPASQRASDVKGTSTALDGGLVRSLL